MEVKFLIPLSLLTLFLIFIESQPIQQEDSDVAVQDGDVVLGEETVDADVTAVEPRRHLGQVTHSQLRRVNLLILLLNLHVEDAVANYQMLNWS
ncbi:hypothetical protein D918_03846 [Trichuris suis]|nr:hypothetical protein D918_03846 [Trichuris suis]